MIPYSTDTGKESLSGGQREFLHRKQWMHHHDSLQLLEVKAREMGIGGQGVIITLLPWLPLLVSSRNMRTHERTDARSPRVGTVLVEQSRYAFWGVWCPPLCWVNFLKKGCGMTCLHQYVLHSDYWDGTSISCSGCPFLTVVTGLCLCKKIKLLLFSYQTLLRMRPLKKIELEMTPMNWIGSEWSSSAFESALPTPSLNRESFSSDSKWTGNRYYCDVLYNFSLWDLRHYFYWLVVHMTTYI